MVRMHNNAATLENNLEVSQKVKQSYLAILCKYLGKHPRELKTRPHKHLHVNVYRGIIRNRQKWRQLTFQQTMNKQKWYILHGISFDHEMERSADTWRSIRIHEP